MFHSKAEWESLPKHARVDFVARQPQSPLKGNFSAKQQTRKPSQGVAAQPYDEELVSGRWLVKAMLATLVIAGIALYLAVCLLFYQGQWQFTFSPPSASGNRQALHGDSLAKSWARRTGPAQRTTPLSAAEVAVRSGLPITDHRFDYTEEGVARLDGWWIPAAIPSKLSETNPEPTAVLFCPNGRSNLPDNVDAFRALHALGISVFAFDYRGFGASQPGHPSQQKAYEDGMAALAYLTNTRHIDPSRIVLYGAGVGSAVAVHVAAQSPQIAGLILENPQPSLAKQVRREQHIHMLPMWLIFTDRFDISRIIPALKMPKLVIATPAQPEYRAGALAIYNQAVAPRQIVHLTAAVPYTNPAWQQSMARFLDSIATQSH